MDCIFCSIIEKQIPAKIVFEDDQVLAFHDVRPLAPVHVLVIPKRHVASMNDFEASDEQLLGHMLLVAKNIAQDLKISQGGYKLLIRTGGDGGQEVPHVHLHLIGGVRLTENIGPANN